MYEAGEVESQMEEQKDCGADVEEELVQHGLASLGSYCLLVLLMRMGSGEMVRMM